MLLMTEQVGQWVLFHLILYVKECCEKMVRMYVKTKGYMVSICVCTCMEGVIHEKYVHYVWFVM